jgi:hypothetical protein
MRPGLVVRVRVVDAVAAGDRLPLAVAAGRAGRKVLGRAHLDLVAAARAFVGAGGHVASGRNRIGHVLSLLYVSCFGRFSSRRHRLETTCAVGFNSRPSGDRWPCGRGLTATFWLSCLCGEHDYRRSPCRFAYGIRREREKRSLFVCGLCTRGTFAEVGSRSARSTRPQLGDRFVNPSAPPCRHKTKAGSTLFHDQDGRLIGIFVSQGHDSQCASPERDGVSRLPVGNSGAQSRRSAGSPSTVSSLNMNPAILTPFRGGRTAGCRAYRGGWRGERPTRSR